MHSRPLCWTFLILLFWSSHWVMGVNASVRQRKYMVIDTLRERKFHRTFVPGSEKDGERIGPGAKRLTTHSTCWRPVMHAQTLASYRAVYWFCSLLLSCNNIVIIISGVLLCKCYCLPTNRLVQKNYAIMLMIAVNKMKSKTDFLTQWNMGWFEHKRLTATFLHMSVFSQS